MWAQRHKGVKPVDDRWAWALVPVVLVLALHTPRIAGLSLSFGFIAQVIFGVWMARTFGRQGLTAFAVGCALASLNVGYSFDDYGWGRIGNAQSDNAIAWLVASLAADGERSPIGSMLKRSGIIRRWAVFWPLLLFGALEFDVFVLPVSSEVGPSFKLWTDGLYVLAILALMLGLAGVGRSLFTTFLLMLAVVLLSDFVHMLACGEDLAPEWSCHPYTGQFRGGNTAWVDSSISVGQALPAFGGLVAAFVIGNYVRRLVCGEIERNALLQSPAKTGLVLVVIGVGLGRYSAIPLTDRLNLSLAGSPTMMMIGAFLLGSRLGIAGVAIAACAYVGTGLVPELIDWRPQLEPFDFRLSTGALLNCVLAALVGIGIRDRRRVPQDVSRRLENTTLFAAVCTLLFGLVDVTSGASLIWLVAATLGAALAVLAIRFREERARAAGTAVTLLTDIVITVAVLVFLQKHVPGILEAFNDVIESANTMAAGDEPAGLQIALLGTRNIPIVTLFFLLFLLLLLNVSVLYHRVHRMVRDLPNLIRMLQRRLRSLGAQPSAATPANGAGEDRGNE